MKLQVAGILVSFSLAFSPAFMDVSVMALSAMSDSTSPSTDVLFLWIDFISISFIDYVFGLHSLGLLLKISSKPLMGNRANFLVCFGVLNMVRYSVVQSISKVSRKNI